MPSWGELLLELNELQKITGNPSFDLLRRKYLAKLSQHTNRNTILYATNWTSPTIGSDSNITINEEDVHGFMETIYGMKGKELDLILHSPGGSAEAAESIVIYLREKFDNIRVIIPHAAMSAATMLACAANCIVMGKHSSLGPIDPQLLIPTQFGVKITPAQAIIDEFEKAQTVSKNEPEKFGAWLPLLSQYGPGLLRQCFNAKALSEELVRTWLKAYMFAGESDAKSKGDKIAKILSSHDTFKSHSRHIAKSQGNGMGLKIADLEDDPQFQDLVLSVFHATNIAFQNTDTVKIIENHHGKTYAKFEQPSAWRAS